jgi:hypothetical protein
MDIVGEAKKRFGYDFALPLAIEIEAGPNWMEQKEVPLKKVA